MSEESEKPDDLADIIREKREMAAEIRAHLSIVPARREEQLLEADSLDREADRIEAAWKRERGEMLDTIVRIGNWCAQDLCEDAYGSDTSGNYLKTLNGLCEICRPFMAQALEREGEGDGR